MKPKVLSLAIIFLVSTNISYAQWGQDVRLTYAPGFSSTSYNNARCIAANGNMVHAVWYDDRDLYSAGDIYYKRSTDGGRSWHADVRLTNNNALTSYPSIAVTGSNVHIVWVDGLDGKVGVFYKLSTDNGINWGADIRLTKEISLNSIGHPSIAVYGSNIHIVWIDGRDGNPEIYYKRTTDGGITWQEDTRLTNNSAASRYPSIAVYGSLVHVVWEDYRDGKDEVYYKRSIDGGETWSEDIRLTNDVASSFAPSIAVSGSHVHIVWQDYRNVNMEIYYKRSTDGGTNWGIDTRLSNATGYSTFPSIAAIGSLVHIVWYDDRDGIYFSEIYYKRSTDGGINWGSETRLTNNPSDSRYPSIACSGSSLHIVWADTRDGNYEIYYKLDSTGNVGNQNISVEIPTAFTLEQNYPNPFNSITKIQFQIPLCYSCVGDSFSDLTSRDLNPHVAIKVFNVLGKEVATLVNESFSPGKHEITFDAGNLTSGIYFYTLEVNSIKITKKCILLR